MESETDHAPAGNRLAGAVSRRSRRLPRSHGIPDHATLSRRPHRLRGAPGALPHRGPGKGRTVAEAAAGAPRLLPGGQQLPSRHQGARPGADRARTAGRGGRRGERSNKRRIRRKITKPQSASDRFPPPPSQGCRAGSAALGRAAPSPPNRGPGESSARAALPGTPVPEPAATARPAPAGEEGRRRGEERAIPPGRPIPAHGKGAAAAGPEPGLRHRPKPPPPSGAGEGRNNMAERAGGGGRGDHVSRAPGTRPLEAPPPAGDAGGPGGWGRAVGAGLPRWGADICSATDLRRSFGLGEHGDGNGSGDGKRPQSGAALGDRCRMTFKRRTTAPLQEDKAFICSRML